MKNKLILAIVGMPGSGKSEVVKYLEKKYLAPVVYFGAATFDELQKANLPVNEKNERFMREKIRKDLGMGAYATLNLPKIKNLAKTHKIIIVESLYSWSEYKILKKSFGDNFKVLASVAAPAVRQKRLGRRKVRPLSKDEVLARDYSEIENLEKGGPIAMADITITNEGKLADLHNKLNQVKL